MKKILTITLSLVMVFAMSASVYAAANPVTGGNAITIEKNLKVTNPTLTSVDGPGATFTYAVAPVAPAAGNGGTSISDGEHTGTVHQGPAGGLTLSEASIAYPIGTAVNASASGADNIKSITATANIASFTAPGIYRYQLTETSALGDCEAANTNGTRYIDVYIENDTAGLKVAGVVMHDGDVSAAHKKTFDDATFETVNVTLKKEVAGNMADKNHEFPFTAAISDHGRAYYAAKGTAPTSASASSTAATQSTSLKHDEMYYISGLSKSATVGYTETNNTQDTYSVTFTGGQASDVAPSGTKAMGATDVDNAGAVVFTNTLESVSPTGVIMRFGPYVGLIVIAGALIFMRKRASVQK